MPLLIREVFHIHVYFISITLAIFGVLTWRFAATSPLRATPLAVWLAISIAIFWGSLGNAVAALQLRALARKRRANGGSLGAVSRLWRPRFRLPRRCWKELRVRRVGPGVTRPFLKMSVLQVKWRVRGLREEHAAIAM